MGETEGTDTQGEGQNGSTPPANQNASPPTVGMSQDEMTRRMTAEKNEGKRAAMREIAEQLGVSIDQAKDIIKAQQDAENSKKSEAERLRSEAQTAKQAAEAAKAEAAAERKAARIERALGKAGVDEDNLADVALLVKVEEDADAEAVDAAVKALKERIPALFGEQQSGGGKKQGAPSSVPSGGPPPPKGQDDAYSRGLKSGQELAKSGRPVGLAGAPK